MIPSDPDARQKEAFRLFEEGRYQESLGICTVLLRNSKDPALEVLTATNLYYTGRLDDAEASFRDLARKIPASSYIHSYLGKVLEARADDGAVAEYATAVHLDPTNQEALRSYAGYLVSRGDYRGALPVLRTLVQLGKKPADVRDLMRALIGIGNGDEALATHAMLGGDTTGTPEFIDALIITHNYQAAAQASINLYRATRDRAFLRKYLDSLSRYDQRAALEAYAVHVREDPDTAILFDYITLLKSSGDLAGAYEVMQTLLAYTCTPPCRLAECELLSAMGREDLALAAYQALVREELAVKNDMEELARIVGSYRKFLEDHLPPAETIRRFLSLVSADVNVVSLLETARLFEESGNSGEARSWYYRAYRADFLAGGLAYAPFLLGQGEERECEKVMLYILSNVKKNADIGRVATVILGEGGRMSRMKRLMERLIRKLQERRPTLNTDGLELLAGACLAAAAGAEEERDYTTCKYYCLCGMDVLPAYARTIRIEDYLSLIQKCKESAVAEQPVMNALLPRKRTAAVPAEQVMTEQLGLTDQEKKIVEFLRSHRKATEMDLRKILGSRRVAGIVNQVIQKTSSLGISLIGKRGVGEDGEVYEYTGT